jgi:hypothetical protein
MFICILLLVKYHPFREHTLERSDSAIIFNSAVFLFFNLGIIETLTRASKNATKDITAMISKPDNSITESNNEDTYGEHPEPYM